MLARGAIVELIVDRQSSVIVVYFTSNTRNGLLVILNLPFSVLGHGGRHDICSTGKGAACITHRCDTQLKSKLELLVNVEKHTAQETHHIHFDWPHNTTIVIKMSCRRAEANTLVIESTLDEKRFLCLMIRPKYWEKANFRLFFIVEECRVKSTSEVA